MRILLIEDDRDLCHALKLSLEQAGYQTDLCHSGTDALYYALNTTYDLIILDRMLPNLDGLSILKIIRANKVPTPVILATAMDAVSERIAGLDCGADDYIVKPYDIGELLARIRALIRRPSVLDTPDILTYADLSYDPLSHELICRQEQKKVLSRREALLIEYFLKNPEKTLPRQVLYTYIWGPDGEVEDGNLDTYIYYVRKILKTLQSQTQISTVHGIGYRLEKIIC